MTMEPADAALLLIATAAAIGAIVWIRDPDRAPRHRRSSDRRVGPSPSDKYLPAWVILSMSIAVWLLAAQVNAIVRDICGHPGRCTTGASPPASSASAPVDAKP